ncbi:copper-binding protein [Roseateles sp. DB2]|uniref:copper-binding protein n=1 Tax=Roseateles sp. DB2 TaxID=3453717 RepID=UPI003EED3AD7
MKAIKTLTLVALVATGAAFPAIAKAQAQAQAMDMTEGEIRKIDKENKKLTIKHGEIRNLQMPGMTMVFQVKDAAVLEQVKVGDKVRFKVERGPTGLLVTDLQPGGN